MKLPIHVIWQQIYSNAGHINIVFPHYRTASYHVHGDYVIPNYTDIRIHKRYFEEAWAKMPVSGPDVVSFCHIS